MQKLFRNLALLVVVGLLVAGCSQEQAPLTSQNEVNPALAASFTLPPGAAFVSATFYINVTQASNQPVRVHRITSDWDEATVTWNSFGGAYNPTVLGSFNADDLGWRSVDVTALVGSWLNGTNPPYGLLLDQPEVYFAIATYDSRQAAANQPYLLICHTLGCETVYPTDDAYIRQYYPDNNWGLLTWLSTGWGAQVYLEKQSLVKFDVGTSQPCLAALGDFVWYDENENGLQDGGEPGAPGVTVRLYNCAGQLIGTRITDAAGYYLFADLQPGDYNVQFVAPEGYDFTLQNQGANDAIDSDADQITGIAACTHLDACEIDLTWDAGLVLIPRDGCTLTIGFWRTHGGFGPQPDLVTALLPKWLGTPGGLKSINVNTGQIAHDILTQDVYGDPSNGITKLYAQLLGAKLNIASGANGAAVSTTIAAADAFLATKNWLNWNSLTSTQKKNVLKWHYKLDQYNNGLVGPGHCD
ncbi:MAG TPA: SdrD B-like domain-containing protein [Candidatus Deferrimicrobium sp.]|nr:SdrD B-like domain-containing protein [Candidatus Deferrimicrobium sp.]